MVSVNEDDSHTKYTGIYSDSSRLNHYGEEFT